MKNDRIVIYTVSYTWPLQTLTKTEIFDWNCNYYMNTSDNLSETWLWQNTDIEKIEVIIEWVENSIAKNMICELYDVNNNLYWTFKITRVKKNKSISWKVNNTHLIVTSFDGSEGW